MTLQISEVHPLIATIPTMDQAIKVVPPDPKYIWALAIVPHTVAIIFSLVAIVRNRGAGNLPDFLGAAHDMLRGKDIYNGGTGGYVYPPLIAFLYQPLAAMSLRNAALISLAINATLSILTLVMISHIAVRRLIGRTSPRLVAGVALFGSVFTADKIKGEFSHLETNVFMLLAFTIAMSFVDSQPLFCGMALGFAFNIKYMPVALVPYLMLRRRWSAILWFCVWAIAFGLLPALSMGWTANAHAWSEASAGLLNLFGIHSVNIHPAHLRKMTDAVSISITSGIARKTGVAAPIALVISLGVAAFFILAAATVYVRNNIALIRWPDVWRQASPPFRGLLSVEWIGMLLMILIFSPFTNSRHLYMLLDVNIAAGALILGSAGAVRRLPLILATLLMALGISCPPGGVPMFENPGQLWRGSGGPGWCMLAMFAVLIWTNVKFQCASQDELQIQ